MKTSYVYILASASRVLYTGVTNNLKRRVLQHRSKLQQGFTARLEACCKLRDSKVEETPQFVL